jgi:hypothetical protein
MVNQHLNELHPRYSSYTCDTTQDFHNELHIILVRKSRLINMEIVQGPYHIDISAGWGEGKGTQRGY